jgi:integrase
MGPEALVQYAHSQVEAGMDKVAIANRMKQFMHLTRVNFNHSLSVHRACQLMAELRREKAISGGPKRKPLVSMPLLRTFLTEIPNSERDLSYQMIWFVLIATGTRPADARRLKYRISDDAIEVQFNGRKNESASSARFWVFPFIYSSFPPNHVARALRLHQQLPQLGSAMSYAACINKWLKAFCTKNSLPEIPLSITSCCPRVRMDNFLRHMLDQGSITTKVYEAMMGHSVEVSDQAYLR